MLINMIRIAFRMIAKQKIYTLINLTGLAIGITVSLFILLYVIDELQYDAFHKDADNIYRVNLYGRLSSQEFKTCYTAAPLASGMSSEIPEIQQTCRIAIRNDVTVKLDDLSFTERKILVADSNYFNFFSFALQQGDARSVLNDPDKVVLTESTANRLFGYQGKGDNGPIGRMLVIGAEKAVFRVAGITGDPPHNSHFHYSIILPMESWDYSQSQSWLNCNLITYVKLNENSSWQATQKKFPALVKKYAGPQVQASMGISMDDFFNQGGAYGYLLQPLLKIHLHSDLDQDIEPGGNVTTIYILLSIVIFVMIIACINFMNLSTARFSNRAREVGIRKTMGASKRLLILQFLGESFLLTFLSFLIALVLIALLLTQLNILSGKDLHFHMLLRFDILSGIILFLITIGLLSGSYPSFYLTSFKPVEVLKGKISAGKGSGQIRRTLVVFQFFISIVLIISTLVVFKQLKHLDKKDLGFNDENVLVIKNADVLGLKKISFKEELKKINGITNACLVSQAPPEMVNSDIFMPVKDDAKDIGFNFCFADVDLQSALGLTMVSGRYFSADFPSDSGAIVINEAAARLIGWENATGEQISTHWNLQEEPRRIIGVVKDFNFQTLKKKVTPLAIFPGTEGKLLIVRLSKGNVLKTIHQISDKWSSFTGGLPFEYSFMDQDFTSKFRKEQQLARVFLMFTFLALIIACLGLFGLSTFMAEQRRKEMGVRKVLGASWYLIIKALSKEFFGLVLIAFLLAIPVTFFIINWWLNGFAYRINMNVFPFLYGGLSALLFTFLSVVNQSLKIANKNPVESLKYE